MKEYNRKTKRWEEKDNTNIKLKKRDTCKGGKLHDWVLTLPYGYEHIEGLYVDAKPVYEAFEALQAMYNTLHEELEKVGIRKIKTFYLGQGYIKTKEYVCSVCGKHHYGDL